MLFLCSAVSLHNILDVCGFIIAEYGLVFFCAIMDNRIYGTFENLAGSIEHISNDIQNLPARFQPTLQQANCLVFFHVGKFDRPFDTLLFVCLMAL